MSMIGGGIRKLCAACSPGLAVRSGCGGLGPMLASAAVMVLAGATFPAPRAAAQQPAPALPQPCAGNCNGLPPVATGNVTITSHPQHVDVTLNQGTNKAILNWKGFDVGPGGAANFYVPNAGSVVVNRVWGGAGPNGASLIQGQVQSYVGTPATTAPPIGGNIYIINQNGILFGKGAQVNVGTLTASTLNVQDRYLLGNILDARNIDEAPLFRNSDGANGAPVEVEAGAILRAHAEAGRIMLIGGSVTNRGEISAPPTGQVLLLGGSAVFIDQAKEGGGRGLMAAVDGTGTVTNAPGATVSAPQGNVTLASLIVNQEGMVKATTSVNFNGSIRLTAGTAAAIADMQPTRGGTLRLGSASVTQVQPEADDPTTSIDAQQFTPSSIQGTGLSVTVQAGAQVRAPGGTIALRAADPTASVPVGTSDGSTLKVEAGSSIDASGTRNATAPMERNFVTAELRGNELQDSPLQRSGFLHGKKVVLDTRRLDADGNIPLANVSAYTRNVARTVAERTASGGSVMLSSGGDLAIDATATIDVSGGSVQYLGGYGASTRLLDANGRVHDIMTAPNDLRYVAFADSFSTTTYTVTTGPVTQTWSAPPTYTPGYVEGRDAGSITLQGPAISGLGRLVGTTQSGPYQRVAPTPTDGAANRLSLGSRLPLGAGLSINGPGIGFGTAPVPGTLSLASDQLVAAGFSRLAFTSLGDITVARGTTLTLPAGGSLALTANSVTVDGTVSVPAGSVTITAAPQFNGAPGPGQGAPGFELGADASILARGRWTNDYLTRALGGATTSTIAVDGGSVSITVGSGLTGGELYLAPGSVIDVSGGGHFGIDRSLAAGRGGDITLATFDDTQTLALGAQLRGYGIDTGGSLSIRAPRVRIGAPGADPTQPGRLDLAPELFASGGFLRYAITGIAGVVVDPGTRITAQAQNLVLSGTPLGQPDGTDLYSFAAPALLPAVLRKPVDVALQSTLALPRAADPTLSVGNVLFGAGASLTTDIGGSLALSAAGRIQVDGTLSAPAGQIDLAILNTQQQVDDRIGYRPEQTIWLGSQARLLAPGAAVVLPGANGLRTGELVNEGGNRVQLSAPRGYVVAETGSVIDVSGASVTLDLPQPGPVGPVYRPQALHGSAGSIVLLAREGMFLDATLRGTAAGPGAAGGTFSATLDRLAIDNNMPSGAPDVPFPNRESIISLAPLGTSVPAGLGPGDPVALADNGMGRLAGTALREAGFATIALSAQDAMSFAGSTEISAGRSVVLDTPQIRAQPDSRITVQAPQVALMNTRSGASAAAAALAGTRLDVKAQLLDVRGNPTLSGFAVTHLASSGDIRFSGIQLGNTTDVTGTLTVSGDLRLSAQDVYPTTFSRYTVSARDSITIDHPAGGSATVPLSAGGVLSLRAPRIDQRGTLRAPLGRLELGGPETTVLTLGAGSVTSVAAQDMLIPFGTLENGSEWVYATSTGAVTIGAPPAKTVLLQSTGTLTVDTGAHVDLSGGGDLYAYEFVPGTGGSHDVLEVPGTYAVLPWLQQAYAPVDPLLRTGSVPRIGDAIYLAGSTILPAGYYTLLPANYALLPGGVAVQAVPGTRDQTPGFNAPLADGSVMVAGKRAVLNTAILDSRWNGWLLTPGNVVRTQSRYAETTANAFFGAGASPRPLDAGRLVLAAGQALNLESGRSIALAAAAGGRGGEVDITSARIAVVDAHDPGAPGLAGYLQLEAGALADSGAASLLLGGIRTVTEDGTLIETQASAVELRNSSAHPLTGPEILLAARDQIALRSGSTLEAAGGVETAPRPLLLSGDGALMRAAGGPQAELTRSNSAGAAGDVTIESGATLIAPSLIVDAARNSVVASGASLATANLTASSRRISIVDTGTLPNDGLVLAADRLGAIETLTLRSYTTIDLYGPLVLGAAADGVAAPTLGELVLDGAAVRSMDAGAKTVTAGSITLRNKGVGCGAQIACGTGAGGDLAFVSVTRADGTGGDIALAGGAVRIAGAAATALRAGRTIAARGTGTLAVDQDLVLSAARITAEGAAEQAISAGSSLRTAATVGEVPVPPAALGGKLTLAAAAIEHAGVIDMPAGLIGLTATQGDVLLAPGSVIRASGLQRDYFDLQAAAPGGTVSLQADAGGIHVAAGALIDVSGAPDGDAGEVRIAAPNGMLSVDGMLRGEASAGRQQGRLTVDARSLASLPALRAAAPGFTDSFAVRVRTGDLTIGDGAAALVARHIALAADAGVIDIGEATLDAAGRGADAGGSIELWAGNGVVLRPGARLLASSGPTSPADGGEITIGTLAGSLDLQSGAILDTSGSARGGSILLRAPIVTVGGTPDVAIASLAAGTDVRGGAGDGLLIAEAVRVYSDIPTLTASFLTTATADATAFMAQADAIAARLGRSADPTFHLRPGVEVRNPGATTVSQNLDFSTRRPGGEVGFFTLRSAGAVTVNASLNDGFTSPAAGTLLEAPDSWSYRLVAGADTAAADPLALVAPARGSAGANLALAASSVVRTGTGSIDVAASGDVILNTATTGGAVLYTAGRAAAALDRFDVPQPVNGVSAAYTQDGGDISITALGDVRGTNSRQLVNHWLFRTGKLNPDGFFDSVNPQTSWWVSFIDFRQDVGALGGGDVTVRAGGDVRNLSVSIPTNGRFAGGRDVDGVPPSLADLAVNGGGHLTVEAGGNIDSGAFFVDRGRATLVASGNIQADPARTGALPVLLGVGDAVFDLRAGGALTLGTAFNPTMTSQITRNFTRPNLGVSQTDLHLSYFSTYGGASAVDLTAVRGDLTLAPATTAAGIRAAFPGYNSQYRIFADQGNQAFLYLPPTLNATTLSGDIAVNGGVTLYPASTGDLRLLSAGAIALSGSTYLHLSDANPATLPLPSAPFPQATNIPRLLRNGPPGLAPHAPDPVHTDDPNPVRIYAAGGDIGSINQFSLVLAKPARVQASGDVVSLSLYAQNLAATDITSVIAGGAIRYPLLRDPSTGLIRNDPATLDVAGPGRLELMAGGDIDLGASAGVVTRGNLSNPALGTPGASVSIGAGFGSVDGVPVQPALDAFVDRYLRPGGAGSMDGAYAGDLIAYMTRLGLLSDLPPNMEKPQKFAIAFARFEALGASLQAPLVTQVLAEELAATGRAQGLAGTGYQRGFDAIATLFPLEPEAYGGDLTLFYSQVRTLAGGDVDMLIPGGLVNAGLADPPANAPAKGPEQLGIVAQQSGSVRAYVLDDFQVNTSRVFSVGGGDITIWSSRGDIDAGRGAKSTIIVPPPVVTIDSAGNLSIQLPNGATGAGIGTLRVSTNQPAGDVNLIAPAGRIDAGDAGIVTSGDAVVVAPEIVNPDNITVGGEGIGLPIAFTGPLLSAGAANVANSATTTASALGAPVEPMAATTPPPTLAPPRWGEFDVEVLDIGNE